LVSGSTCWIAPKLSMFHQNQHQSTHKFFSLSRGFAQCTKASCGSCSFCTNSLILESEHSSTCFTCKSPYSSWWNLGCGVFFYLLFSILTRSALLSSILTCFPCEYARFLGTANLEGIASYKYLISIMEWSAGPELTAFQWWPAEFVTYNGLTLAPAIVTRTNFTHDIYLFLLDSQIITFLCLPPPPTHHISEHFWGNLHLFHPNWAEFGIFIILTVLHLVCFFIMCIHFSASFCIWA
jgi:hypothetical protein